MAKSAAVERWFASTKPTELVENRSVKHAGPAALDRLDSVLRQVRKLEALRERRRGSFDSRFGVTLHFHADPAGLSADQRAAILRLREAVLRAHRKP